MRRALRTAMVVTLVIGLEALPAIARADPIVVNVTGSAGLDRFSGSIGIFGDFGFSLRGGLDNNQGNVFVGPEFAPGTTGGIGGFWSGIAVSGGVATFRGATFEDVGGLASPNAIQIQFGSGPYTFPALGSSPTTLKAPASLSGSLFLGLNTDESVGISLIGSGMGTIFIAPNSIGNWELQSS